MTAAPTLLPPHSGSGLSQPGLAAGVRAAWNSASVCATHPSFGQHLAFAVTVLPVDLLRLGALYLAMRLARAAARDGVYTAAFARLLLTLGWWLLAGGLVATVAEALARMDLLEPAGHLARRLGPVARGLVGVVAGRLDLGLGLIIFARIMRTSAGMRADLEGTIECHLRPAMATPSSSTSTSSSPRRA